MEFEEKWNVRCRRLMRERGLTQDQLAERIREIQPTVSKWLRGLREPTMDDFRRIADALTEADPAAPISAAYLMWGDPSDVELAASVHRALVKRQAWNFNALPSVSAGIPHAAQEPPPKRMTNKDRLALRKAEKKKADDEIKAAKMAALKKPKKPRDPGAA